MALYYSAEELIGKTPLVKLDNIKRQFNLKADLFAKVEFFNPAGSVKDRVAYNMIAQAEKDGIIKKGSVIIEPTSGNTGIGLAFVGSLKGYQVIIVMPDNMSKERIKIMQAFGAKVVLTAGEKGMQGAIDKANELTLEMPNSVVLDQFKTPYNHQAHYLFTGKEIYEDMGGKVDAFVAGVGTGGTVTGVGKYLKERLSNVKIIGVEPSSSAVLTTGVNGKHGIQGIGAGFIPQVLDVSVLDEVFAVTEEESYECAKLVCQKEGLLVGISSGASLAVAIKLAQKDEYEGKKVVVLLPDGGERYLSTELFKD